MPTSESVDLLKDLSEKKQSFRRNVVSLATELKQLRTRLVEKERLRSQEAMLRQKAETRVKRMEDEMLQLRKELNKKVEQTHSSDVAAEMAIPCGPTETNRKVAPPQHQVFINFRGEELRNNFISHLVEALKRNEINFFIDYQEPRGEDISILLKRIEDSRIALVVFSSKYTESSWCLREAAKIKDCVEQGILKVLPIFYKVSTMNVKQLKGEFGDHFRDREREYRSHKPRIERWKDALAYISGKLGLTFDEKRISESDFIGTIVKEVLRLLASIPSTAQSVNS